MALIVTVASRRMPTATRAALAELLEPSENRLGDFAIYEGRTARFASKAHLPDGVLDHGSTAQRPTAILAQLGSERESSASRTLADTGPFSRELAGRLWTIAESGRLGPLSDPHFARFKPLGTAPSEYALCLILDSMRFGLEDDGSIASPLNILNALAKAICRIESEGEFDFLLTDGEQVIAYSSTEIYFTRQKIDGTEVLTVASNYQRSQHGWACILPKTLTLLNVHGIRGQFEVDCQEQQPTERAILGGDDFDYNCS
ncbi:class II glutamine amidotransferase [Bosea sp. 2KB_26]|uniref:class II glutamine amidotransferase n=1 Tax=Bosea sp. 2KB_26 TaxID=3237475 RepID=UPI003F915CA9